MKTKTNASPLFIVPLCLSVLLTPVAMALDLNGATIKELIPQQRELLSVMPNIDYLPTLKKDEKPLKVTAWVDNKDAEYRLGDTVKFSIKVNKNAYITLLNIGTAGKTHIIFPNQFQSDSYIRANETLSIPQANSKFHFKVSGKKGWDLVKIIATSTPQTIIPSQYLADTESFKAVTKNIDIVANTMDEILNNPLKPTEWAEYSKILRIY